MAMAMADSTKKKVAAQQQHPAQNTSTTNTTNTTTTETNRTNKQSTSPPPPPPPPPDDWTRCHAYLKRKNRFCRQEVLYDDPISGAKYCGNHQHLVLLPSHSDSDPDVAVDGDGDDKQNDKNKKRRKQQTLKERIPCPIDPSHLIYAADTAKHVLVCPRAKQRNFLECQPYFRRNVNMGGYGCLCLEGKEENVSMMGAQNTAAAVGQRGDDNNNNNNKEEGEEQQQQLAWTKAVASRVLAVHQQVFHFDDTKANNNNTNPDRNTTKTTFAMTDTQVITERDILQAIPLHDLSKGELERGLEQCIEAYRIRSGGPKHLYQQASLVGQLRAVGAVPSRPCSSCPSQAWMRTFDADAENQQTTATATAAPPPCKRTRRTFLELGAGRGITGMVAAGVAAAAATETNGNAQRCLTRLILLERSGCRSKADKILRNCQQEKQIHDAEKGTTSYMNLHDIQWQRIQCDLAHVDMTFVVNHDSPTPDEAQAAAAAAAAAKVKQEPQVPSVAYYDRDELHVVTKHLCGAGTDLALKSLEPIKDQLSSCVMATCCHGLCTWEEYVGRDFLRQIMMETKSCGDSSFGPLLSSFGKPEFELLRAWSAASVAGPATNNTSKMATDPSTQKSGKDSKGRDEEEHSNPCGKGSGADPASPTSVSRVVRELQLACGVQGLGRACQRLIDFGRREYMRQVLFHSPAADVKLIHYVSAEMSPQNAALIAQRKTQASS